MANAGRGERVSCPVEEIEVGEEPTTCTHCGARTGLIGMHVSGAREESCDYCWQRYLVTDAPETAGEESEIEVVDPDTGKVVGTTAPLNPGMSKSDLDKILLELSGALPEASQKDLNHLFGIKTPNYPGFGEFS